MVVCLYVSPEMDWRPVQGEPAFAHPAPHDPKEGYAVWIMDGWMLVFEFTVSTSVEMSLIK